MEVYLVRHTKTVCPKGICYGQSDVGILEPYEDQFSQILSQLPQEARLFSSPLKRCLILANYLQENSNMTATVVDSRLMEMNFGDWELQAWNDIPREILDPWMNDFVTVSIPNGESFIDLDQRVWEFLETKIKNKIKEPVVIVTHSGVIRSILCKIKGLPLQDAFVNTLDYGVVLKIDLA